jgi:hypothetical protein
MKLARITDVVAEGSAAPQQLGVLAAAYPIGAEPSLKTHQPAQFLAKADALAP